MGIETRPNAIVAVSMERAGMPWQSCDPRTSSLRVSTPHARWYTHVMEPATIAAQLREISVYFDLDGDRHRAIAYDRAARSIEAANGLHRLLDEGRLEELPHIGPSIARVVGDLAR